ncbi:Hypothetical predicted protein [Prunus dulcis]|uniref:Uncharacterized protein n=1 Tax=Prunus dulcis TaxID=3755 RepID=A0A5E4E1U0_PRUDU|nr:hypothetical protein L3X38_039301 [Prunus dulcis]VVA09743.1 Hypothetical predicted protein [Prunus dulcis]
MTQKPKAGRGEVLERSRIANRRTTAKLSDADRVFSDLGLTSRTSEIAFSSPPPHPPLPRQHLHGAHRRASISSAGQAAEQQSSRVSFLARSLGRKRIPGAFWLSAFWLVFISPLKRKQRNYEL